MAAEQSDDHPFPDPVPVPLDGALDLHGFRPADVADVTMEYLRECRARGIARVRIIHGKGIGAIRETVHAALSRCPEVVEYHLAGSQSGGWGATIVVLKPRGEEKGRG